jgi:hypothetical protein
MSNRKRLAAAFIAAMSVAASIGSSSASTFVAWQVTGVASDDLLNVRAYPSSTSRIVVGYPTGTVLSMTGRCTGGINLHDIQGRPTWQQRQIVRYKWCETWLDADGDGEFTNGWVYGRYIRPA